VEVPASVREVDWGPSRGRDVEGSAGVVVVAAGSGGWERGSVSAMVDVRKAL
jgi:hypothetical protein